MKRPVPGAQRAIGVTFSLKPALHRQLLSRVEALGYPWTKSAYVTKLVVDDLVKHGLWPADSSEVATADEIDAFIKTKNEENIRIKAARKRKPGSTPSLASA
jgi:hypothetical protein